MVPSEIFSVTIPASSGTNLSLDSAAPQITLHYTAVLIMIINTNIVLSLLRNLNHVAPPTHTHTHTYTHQK